MTCEVVSINVGKVKVDTYKGKNIQTAIYKTPIEGRIFVSSMNITGDEQADLINHGGKDKALLMYPHEHYSYWHEKLGLHLQPGAFGENLTTNGLNEDNTCIGDVFELGDITIQVSLPRQPCYKLANKLSEDKLPVYIQDTGFSGFYLRVLKEGYIEPGQTVKLVERHPEQITVSFVNNVKYHDKFNQEALTRLVNLFVLSEDWRSSFQERLNTLTK